MKFVTIDDGERLGIVFPSDDGGTELVYLTRNFEETLARVLNRSREVPERVCDVTLGDVDAAKLASWRDDVPGEAGL